MGVEGRDLEHLGERKPHLLGERRKMAGVEAAIAVLQEMQMLDQKVRLAGASAEKGAHFVKGGGIDLAPLGKVARLAATGARMDAAIGVGAVLLWPWGS